jgi:hypothetical protein
MAAKNVDIKINTTASGNGAQQTAAQMDKLAASSTKAAAATNTVTASSSKLGYRAGAVGLQIQDIAVQAQMGTNAVTILAQQGSQIAGIFGPQGAIIGSIIALGAVAAQTFFKMGDDAEATAKKAEFLADAIEEIAKEAGRLQSEELDMGSEAISRSIKLANELAESFFKASEEERKLSEAALSRSDKLKQAEIELKRMRGEITDEQAVNQERQLAQDQINQKAQLQIQAEQQRAQEAQKALTIARDELATRGRMLDQSQQNLDSTIQKLESLKQQVKDLNQATRETVSVNYAGPGGANAQIQSPRARAAQQELASTPFEAQIKALESRVESLAKATGAGGELYKNLIRAAESLQSAERGAADVSESVAKQSENIAAQAQTETLLLNQKAITENIAAEAKMIEDVVTDIQAVGTLQESAKSQILQAVSDQKITAEEQVKIGQNLTILLTSVKGLQTEQINAIRSLIEYNNTVKIQYDGLQKQINDMKMNNKGMQGTAPNR